MTIEASTHDRARPVGDTVSTGGERIAVGDLERARGDGFRPPRLRVLRVVSRLNVGGPALQTTVLSDGLDPERFEQLLVAGVPDEQEGDFVALRAPHLEVSRVPGLGRAPRPLDDLRALRALVEVIRRFEPDVVHTHTAKAGALGRLAAWLCGVPATVHTFHGHLLRGYFSPVGRAAVVHAERGLARRTSRLVAVGSQVRDELLEARVGTAEQYRVVPPGVPLGRPTDRRGARQELALPEDVPVVAFVGRLAPVKRPDRFVDLATALGRWHPDAVFLIAGGGELEEALRQRVAASGAAVRFLGWRSDVATVYAAADVVVLTSDNEGMPLSLIEASLAGRPCVATKVGSTAEVVANGETGFVTSADAGELALAVDRLLSDQGLRARMGAAAADRACALFSAERLVADMADIYEELVSPSSAQRRVVGARETVMRRGISIRGRTLVARRWPA